MAKMKYGHGGGGWLLVGPSWFGPHWLSSPYVSANRLELEALVRRDLVSKELPHGDDDVQRVVRDIEQYRQLVAEDAEFRRRPEGWAREIQALEKHTFRSSECVFRLEDPPMLLVYDWHRQDLQSGSLCFTGLVDQVERITTIAWALDRLSVFGHPNAKAATTIIKQWQSTVRI